MSIRTEAVMGTLVTIQVAHPRPEASAAVERALGWFYEIERRCSRFEEGSELMQLTARPGVRVPVSAILYEAVQFAVRVAEETGGAFDPTAGRRPAVSAAGDVSYRDVQLDPDRNTILLLRPLTLDLGAVAKGLAVDMAARELAPLRDFAVDAGGDLYLGGRNPQGEPWRVGIRHPRREGELLASVRVSDQAVCTSGDYERPHHILDPRTGVPSGGAASVTVVASGAMLADALATAAFVLGPDPGIQLLERMGVEGLIVTPELERYQTRGLPDAA
ncbi:MAG: FAD:protein FMN transferase [Candidatus Sulfopaludibacter sp.]|nr:FAD:protein FMN transferase [Candidatus Sulfopaludibacter sp.]